MPEYITTYTGLHFYPTSPVKEDIRIEDIAHALSLICRGNGHVKCFYSVGEHCINCAVEAEARKYSKRLVLACLLHDASECYMSDVPRPFKKYIKDYCEMEDRLLSLVYERFLGSDLTDEEAEAVKKIDNDVLKYDLYYLLGEGGEEELPPLFRPYNYGMQGFEETEQRYMRMFQNLTKGIEMTGGQEK